LARQQLAPSRAGFLRRDIKVRFADLELQAAIQFVKQSASLTSRFSADLHKKTKKKKKKKKTARVLYATSDPGNHSYSNVLIIRGAWRTRRRWRLLCQEIYLPLQEQAAGGISATAFIDFPPNTNNFSTWRANNPALGNVADREEAPNSFTGRLQCLFGFLCRPTLTGASGVSDPLLFQIVKQAIASFKYPGASSRRLPLANFATTLSR